MTPPFRYRLSDRQPEQLRHHPREPLEADVMAVVQIQPSPTPSSGAPATNNACEREIRPSVVFRKVTGGFRSDWGAQIHAGYRSVTGTARLHGQTARHAIGQLLDGTFEQTLPA